MLLSQLSINFPEDDITGAFPILTTSRNHKHDIPLRDRTSYYSTDATDSAITRQAGYLNYPIRFKGRGQLTTRICTSLFFGINLCVMK